MTTLATQDCPPEKKEGEVIPANIRGYFQQRTYSRTHQLLLELLSSEEDRDCLFSKRALAKRIEKRPEQITRWLSYPGNLTLDTISDLALGLGFEVIVSARDISGRHFELSRSIDFNVLNLSFVFVKSSQKKIKENDRFVFSSSSSGNFEFISNELVTRNEVRNNA